MLALIVAVVVSILAVGIGVVGLVSPASQVAFISRWKSSTGLWTSAGIRLVFGIALWFVAPASRTPVVLQGLAVLSVVAAILLPFLGPGALPVDPVVVVPATVGFHSGLVGGSGGVR